MNRHVFIFLGAFALGAAVAFVARAALHDPHAGHAAQAAPPAAVAPAAEPVAAPSAPAHDHGAFPAHEGSTAPAAAAAVDPKPVNTVCAICGMDVDPSVPTAEYQGKTIGFGCRLCPPKFARDPDRYGPAALANTIVEN